MWVHNAYPFIHTHACTQSIAMCALFVMEMWQHLCKATEVGTASNVSLHCNCADLHNSKQAPCRGLRVWTAGRTHQQQQQGQWHLRPLHAHDHHAVPWHHARRHGLHGHDHYVVPCHGARGRHVMVPLHPLVTSLSGRGDPCDLHTTPHFTLRVKCNPFIHEFK
jgi:hypothetical protein